MRRHHLVWCAIVALLAACTSKPPVPDWQGQAHSALQSAVAAYLAGDTRVAETDMARARREIARTGQPALLARAELVWCAAHVASLDLAGCPAYAALAVDAAPTERAYAAYLYGKVSAQDVALLPAQHQGVASGRTEAATLQDPLARLIATSVRLQRQAWTPADVTTAVQTASDQGWRRPLLAWLHVELRAAQAAQDADQIQRLQRRIQLVQ
jgi:hypothetical protein